MAKKNYSKRKVSKNKVRSKSRTRKQSRNHVNKKIRNHVNRKNIHHGGMFRIPDLGIARLANSAYQSVPELGLNRTIAGATQLASDATEALTGTYNNVRDSENVVGMFGQSAQAIDDALLENVELVDSTDYTRPPDP